MTDTQFLNQDQLNRLPEYINALANSSGGLVQIEGGQEIHVAPLEWHRRPAYFDGKVFRRVEGQNIISSQRSISVMARDSQNISGDDFPADSACLDRKSLAEFRSELLGRNEYYRQFTRKEFLRRTGIFSGKHLTFAGALMFGDDLRIRAVLNHKDIHAEIEAHNIWRALRDILPRLRLKLSPKSSCTLRNAFNSTLLNADYTLDSHINITILAAPPRIIIDSPGIIRPSIRNHRLAKIFALAGFSPEPYPSGQDMLNFRTIATIPIEEGVAVIL
ncbi:MAG: hypothetical protein IJR85_03175 [Synergistaceae bacterium]|nr:hypothetical protein [Synergistaceae bacterium]